MSKKENTNKINNNIDDSKYSVKYRLPLNIPEGFEIYSSLEVLNSSKVEYKDFVITNIVKSRNVFSNIGAAFKSIVGGNIKAYTYLTNNIRNEVTEHLIKMAKEKNANAIIGYRCEITEIADGIIDFVAYGTAVKFVR